MTGPALDESQSLSAPFEKCGIEPTTDGDELDCAGCGLRYCVQGRRGRTAASTGGGGVPGRLSAFGGPEDEAGPDDLGPDRAGQEFFFGGTPPSSTPIAVSVQRSRWHTFPSWTCTGFFRCTSCELAPNRQHIACSGCALRRHLRARTSVSLLPHPVAKFSKFHDLLIENLFLLIVRLSECVPL